MLKFSKALIGASAFALIVFGAGATEQSPSDAQEIAAELFAKQNALAIEESSVTDLLNYRQSVELQAESLRIKEHFERNPVKVGVLSRIKSSNESTIDAMPSRNRPTDEDGNSSKLTHEVREYAQDKIEGQVKEKALNEIADALPESNSARVFRNVVRVVTHPAVQVVADVLSPVQLGSGNDSPIYMYLSLEELETLLTEIDTSIATKQVRVTNLQDETKVLAARFAKAKEAEVAAAAQAKQAQQQAAAAARRAAKAKERRERTERDREPNFERFEPRPEPRDPEPPEPNVREPVFDPGNGVEIGDRT